MLSSSIAAIAFLSKAFKQATTRSGASGAARETVNIIFAVLEILPGNGQVRNKRLSSAPSSTVACCLLQS
jgi:hypothetical protein